MMFLLALLATTSSSYSTTHTITNSGFTFSPSSITIDLGDTVKFVLGSIHNAREVSQATWDVNGTTSNGGFDLPFGGGTVVLTQTGTHFYVCTPHASGGMKGSITVNSTTDVKSMSGSIQDHFILMQNFPNPFNPSTTISFNIPTPLFVSLKVFDCIGKEVATISSGVMPAGRHNINWNAAELPSGVYFYRIQAGDPSARLPDGQANSGQVFTDVKKLVLLK